MFVDLKKRVLDNKSKTPLMGLVFVFIILVSSIISFCFNNESVSAYSASITTSGPITTTVRPKSGGVTGTSISTDEVNVVTDCRAGYNLTIAGPSDRNLYKDGDSTNNTPGQYFTPVDGSSQLKNTTNAWGYSLTANTDTGIFTPLSNTATAIKTPAQTASETDIDDDINIYYGVSVTATMGPGSYSMSNNNTIIYRLTMDDSCQVYTVSFNANGGTGTMDPQDIRTGIATNLSENSFTAPALGTSYQDADGNTITGTPTTYWAFAGWNTAVDGTGTSYNDAESVTDLIQTGETITLYAQWQAKQIMLVNFEGNGMEFNGGTTTNTVAYYNECTTKYVSSPDYSHTSNINDDGTQIGTTKYDNNLATKDVITIPDADSLHVTITYGTEDNWDMLYVFEGEYTGQVTRNMNAGQLAKYTGGNNTTTTVTIDIPGDTATFAFYSDGSGQYWGYHATIVGYYDEEPSSYDSIAQVCTRTAVNGSYQNPATTAGKQFKGWNSDSSATTPDYTSADDIMNNLPGNNGDTITLYAIWIPQRQIIYNDNCSYNNAGCATNTDTTRTSSWTNAGSNITLGGNSYLTTRSGYAITSWNTARDGSGTSYNPSSSYTVPSDLASPDQVTLYAMWSEVYYISFNANESSVDSPDTATGTMTNQTAIRDIAASIKTNTFALNGFIFRGWNTAADGTGTLYSDGQKITNLASPGGTITLYAVWVKGAYLDTGRNVNQKLKRLAGNSSATSSTQDTAITAIVRSNTLPNNFTPSTENTISDSSSPFPIYAWYDSSNTTIYYYSESATIIMNKNSNELFYEMRALSNLSTISTWDTIKVTSMHYMFYYAGYNASSFTLNLSSWNTSSVTNMFYMFYYAGYNASSFTLNLSSWNTSNVTNMSNMFYYTGYSATTWSIGDLSSWNTSSVTSMRMVFKYAGYSATTWSVGDLSSWNTSSVYDMAAMFECAGYSATTWSVGDLSSWDTTKVANMYRMFFYAGYNASSFTLNLSSWNTSNVTNMSNMFYYTGYSATTWSIGDLSSWDTSSVTIMQGMFSYAGYSATTWSIGDLSSWDTTKVASMYRMFYYAGYTTTTTWSIGDLSSWDTSSVYNMADMFRYAGYNASSFALDLSSWDTSSVTSISSMFYSAGYSATTWSITIPKTNNGTDTGPIANTTSNLYGQTTSVTATPDPGRSFTLAD